MPNELSKNKLIAELTKLNQDNMEAIKQSSESYIKAITYLIQQQEEMVSLYRDGSAKQLEALSQAENIPDLIATQSRLSAELNEKLVNNARQTLQELVKVMRFNMSDLDGSHLVVPHHSFARDRMIELLDGHGHSVDMIDLDGPPPDGHGHSVNMIDPGGPPCNTTSPPSSGCRLPNSRP